MTFNLSEFTATHRRTCHGRCPTCHLLDEIKRQSEVGLMMAASLEIAAASIADTAHDNATATLLRDFAKILRRAY